MKRNFLIVAAIVSLFADIVADAQNVKNHLADYQILSGILPEGILKPEPFIDSVANDGTLFYRVAGKHMTFDIDKYEYGEINVDDKVQSIRNDVPALVEGWQNPTYSPDRNKIAYTLNNDLYSIDVKTKEITRHTYDGSEVILNGYASWVYYEEIFGRPSRYKAFWWSPDSKVIAYYRFDNSDVPLFPIFLPEGTHGFLRETRYPKAGDNNPKVKIGFVSQHGGETVWAEFKQDEDQYFGTPFWNARGDKFMVSRMDRAQDNFMLYAVNPYDGQKQEIYGEHQDNYIDWLNEMLFSEKGVYVVRDITGWQQAYFLSYDGTKFEQLTQGHNWPMHLLTVDKSYLYYTANCEASTRTDIYRVHIKSKKVERISYGDFDFSSVSISPNHKYLVAKASNSTTPPKLVAFSISSSLVGGKIRFTTVYDCRGEKFSDYMLALPEIVNITTRDGYSIPTSVTWPVNMDKSKKYPVKVDLYGGPDHAQVKDRWRRPSLSNQWWANHGVIQVVLDNRDGGHLGKEGIVQAYRHLGTVEFEDYTDGIKYSRSLPFVNGDKIGVEGFSFGGTMTVLCVSEGSDYFKYGIAGGGVYDWALYDSHYTERYMDRPQDNPIGYAEGRVLDRLENYRGDDTNMLRITHGTGDDNVHFQNTLQLIGKLEEMHKDFELMIYPGGMHGYRGDQQKHSDYQDYKFWYRYLLGIDMPSNLREYLLK